MEVQIPGWCGCVACGEWWWWWCGLWGLFAVLCFVVCGVVKVLGFGSVERWVVMYDNMVVAVNQSFLDRHSTL